MNQIETITINRISAERRKQRGKGFTSVHDDTRTNRTLAFNASFVLTSYLSDVLPPKTPYTADWGLGQKHHGKQMHLLTIAAALIVAEMERLDRANAPAPPVKSQLDYVDATELVPKEWYWFWSDFSDSCPFSYGDNNLTLVTVARFLDHCETVLQNADIEQEDKDEFLKRLDLMDQKSYINLEG